MTIHGHPIPYAHRIYRIWAVLLFLCAAGLWLLRWCPGVMPGEVFRGF